MLDIKRIRQNPQELLKALKTRGKDAPIDQIIAKDDERRKLLAAVEEKKACRNVESKRIGLARKNGASETEMNQITERVRSLSEEITSFDMNISELDASLQEMLLSLPNYPHNSVPVGLTEEDNIEIRRWGIPRPFLWEPKAHWDIGTDLRIMDGESASKTSGARFTVYRGLGARLERAIINFFLNAHCENGYEEISPLVNGANTTITGQLSKFEEDAYQINKDAFLISALEVPVTNLYQGMILKSAQLPIRHCAYSACFRSEAGSSERDTRGLICQYRSNTVELVKITKPEQSYDELESMVVSAENVLRLLGLPYRVVLLSTGALEFSVAKTYAIEVWMPSYNCYVEISSCSNCEDFQARRAGIRYHENPKDKPQYVHTLNGSGAAVGRTVAAILENYQNEDGTVTVPDVLRPYMGTDLIK